MSTGRIPLPLPSPPPTHTYIHTHTGENDLQQFKYRHSNGTLVGSIAVFLQPKLMSTSRWLLHLCLNLLFRGLWDWVAAKCHLNQRDP